MFAPAHHQATRYVIPVRRELAVRTIFNFLGPLTNPAGADRQLIGVSDPDYLETMAGALRLLGTRRALLVSSEDGLDELSISAPTTVVDVAGERTPPLHRRHPRASGCGATRTGRSRRRSGRQRGRDPARSSPGPTARPRDLAVLNAGAAILAGGGAESLASWRARCGSEAIDSGRAAETLERFVARTNELAAT